MKIKKENRRMVIFGFCNKINKKILDPNFKT